MNDPILRTLKGQNGHRVAHESSHDDKQILKKYIVIEQSVIIAMVKKCLFKVYVRSL